MKTPKLTGPRLIKAAVNQILLHPESWDQTVWHSECGTKHCIGGWMQILSQQKPQQKPRNFSTIYDKEYVAALNVMGLSDIHAGYLFSSWRTLLDLYIFAAHIDQTSNDKNKLVYEFSKIYLETYYSPNGYNIKTGERLPLLTL